MNLASVRIVTKDVKALAKFYEDVTMAKAVGNDDYMELRTSGSVLALCSVGSVASMNNGAAISDANKSVILEFQADDLEVEYTRLKTIVPEWVMAPTVQPWGNKSMLFRDLDGNLINVFSPFRF